ncbi:MAG: alpha/beta hydrolase [Gammaproteobacteria bacterium]
MDSRIGEPLFFGDVREPLFGCLHSPSADARDAAVILPAAGHEYVSSHRTVRQLAIRLASQGCAALRVDLYGCGDSAGAKDSGTLERWAADAAAATGYLRARAPHARLHLVGLRLGASLATLCGAGICGLESVVLWDPVFRGADYLAQGVRLHQRRFSTRQSPHDAEPIEILGYALSAQLVHELKVLDLGTLEAPPAPRALIVTTGAQSGTAPLTRRLAEIGAKAQAREVEAPDLWTGDGHVAIVPTAFIQIVAEWIAGT